MPALLRILCFGVLALLGACSDSRLETRVPAGGDFVLQAKDGPLASLQLRGQVVVVVFGYTHCPDLTQQGLRNAAQALNQLKPEQRARIKLLLVTVDPERDTLERLATYTAYWHPDLVGATGRPEELARLQQRLSAVARRLPAGADGSYDVLHSERIHVLAPDGRLGAILERGTPGEQLLDTLRKFL